MTIAIRTTFLCLALFLAAGLRAQDTPVYFAPDPGVAELKLVGVASRYPTRF